MGTGWRCGVVGHVAGLNGGVGGDGGRVRVGSIGRSSAVGEVAHRQWVRIGGEAARLRGTEVATGVEDWDGRETRVNRFRVDGYGDFQPANVGVTAGWVGVAGTGTVG